MHLTEIKVEILTSLIDLKILTYRLTLNVVTKSVTSQDPLHVTAQTGKIVVTKSVISVIIINCK